MRRLWITGGGGGVGEVGGAGDGRITAGDGCFQNGTLRPDHAWLGCHSRGFGPELVVA